VLLGKFPERVAALTVTTVGTHICFAGFTGAMAGAMGAEGCAELNSGGRARRRNHRRRSVKILGRAKATLHRWTIGS